MLFTCGGITETIPFSNFFATNDFAIYIGLTLQGGVRDGGTPNFDSWILLTDSGVCSGVNAIQQAPLEGV